MKTFTESVAVRDPSYKLPAVVQPPPSVSRFSFRRGEGPGTWIDYAAHPAYALLVRKATASSKLASLRIFVRYFGLILCKRLISYELIPANRRKMKSLKEIAMFATAACGGVLAKLLPDRACTVRGDQREVAAALVGDGISVAKVHHSHYEEISRCAQRLFDALREVRGICAYGGRRFDESRSSALRGCHDSLFGAVETMLDESGIIASISTYLGRPAALVDVNPQINDPSDDFWRRIFPDMELPELPAAYFHRDASGGDVKAILYMSDVQIDNGPFCYAIGSHRVRSGHLIDWIEETNDQSGFSSTDAVNRARFAALPTWLQRKCAFGNDVLAGTDIADRLLAAEWVITAPRGHIVLFDTKGFHRGGMVAKGERLVLTCVIG